MAKSSAGNEIELHDDAWGRFERAATTVAKSPPQHREQPAKPMISLKRKKAKQAKKKSKK